MNVYFVYILLCSDGSIYVGCTNDLEDRLRRHSVGQVLSTKNRLPIRLLIHVCFPDRYKAYFFEKYLKSGSGRAFVRKHFV